MIPLLPPFPISAEDGVVILVGSFSLALLVALLVKAYDDYR